MDRQYSTFGLVEQTRTLQTIQNNKQKVQAILCERKGSEKEAKIIKNMSATTVIPKERFDFSLDKYELHKVLKVSAWVTRFINNCRKK